MWLTNWVRRFPLVAYFVLVFATTWTAFLVLSPLVSPLVAILIGSWVPNVVGLLVTGVADGRAGLRDLLGRAATWRIDIKWYAISMFGPVVMALPVILLSGSVQERAPVIPFTVAALGLTLLVTWTLNLTGGSLIPPFLYHCGFNFIGSAAGIFGVPDLFWLMAGVIGFAALSVVALDWKRFTRPAGEQYWSRLAVL